jgi:hypothetical protein
MITKEKETNLDWVGEMLVEGLRKQGEIYQKSTSWLDDDEFVKTNENTYYNEEDDYYVIITSLHSVDEIEWDEEIEDETKQILIEDWIDCVRDENGVDDDYSSYEIVRKHLKTDGLWMSDYYSGYGLGEIHLKKQQ